MAVADTARLIASLDLKGNFDARIRASEKALGSFDAKLDRTQSRAYRAGQQIGTGIKAGAAIAVGAVAFIGANVVKGIQSLEQLESEVAQTNAVLKSTKGVAGQTAESIRNLAEKYEGLNATIDDKVIQSGENLLLTFTNIRKDAFEPALQTALDMNAALGGGEAGLNGTVQKLGKALNDPVKGLTALGRVGIVFTKQQKDQITTAVKAGDTFKAQGIILAELNKRFGGSFLAGGATTQGKVAKFKDAIEDLQKGLAQALLPTIGKVADALTKFLADPKVVKGVSDLGTKIASLFSDKNLAAAGGVLSDLFETAKSAAPIIEGSAKATLTIVQAAVGLFKSLPAPLQQLAVGAFAVNKLTGGLVTNIVGGIGDILIKQRGATPANPLFVADVTGGVDGLLGGAGAAAGAGEAAAAAGGLGLGTIGAGVAAGTAVAALGIMGLGWLITATSTPDQLATSAQNAIDQNRLKHGLGGVPTKTGPLTGPAGNVTPNFSRLAFDLGKVGNLTPQFSRLAADFGAVGTLLKGMPRQLEGAMRTGLIAVLAKANKPADVAKATAAAVKEFVTRKQGNLGETQKLLAGLEAKLKTTHDPKTASILRAAIHDVQTKLPPRQLAVTAVAKADGILKSNKTSAEKLKGLQTIENDLKNHKLPGALKKVEDKVASVQRAAAATKAAVAAVTAAVNAQDLSVTFKPTITVPISVGGITRANVYVGNYQGKIAT